MHHHAHHVAAVVGLSNNAIGLVAIKRSRANAAPGFRPRFYRVVFKDVGVTVSTEACDHDTNRVVVGVVSIAATGGVHRHHNTHKRRQVAVDDAPLFDALIAKQRTWRCVAKLAIEKPLAQPCRHAFERVKIVGRYVCRVVSRVDLEAGIIAWISKRQLCVGVQFLHKQAIRPVRLSRRVAVVIDPRLEH